MEDIIQNLLRETNIDWNNESELIIRKIGSRSQRLSVTYLKVKREFYIKKASHSKIKNYNFVNGQVIDKDKKRAHIG